MWLLFPAILVLVPAMLGFMFWRAGFRMRQDRVLGERAARAEQGERPGGTRRPSDRDPLPGTGLAGTGEPESRGGDKLP